jgi:hypothetical protein
MPPIVTLYYHRPDGTMFGITVPRGYQPTYHEVNRVYSHLQVQAAIKTASVPSPAPDLSPECHTVLLVLTCVATGLFWYPTCRKRRCRRRRP